MLGHGNPIKVRDQGNDTFIASSLRLIPVCFLAM